jgi:ribosomal protein S18 acetylase RimI-like enzyme
VMRRLISTANKAGEGITLGVIKINPAQRLYERLGFKTTHEDDRNSTCGSNRTGVVDVFSIKQG